MGMARADEPNVEGKVEELEEYRPVPVVEQGNGAVLLDISHAKGEPGGANLKLTKDGHVSTEQRRIAFPHILTPLQTVLIPQPSDDPNDPLNWSELKKNLLLLVISLSAFQSDFQTAAGVPGVVLQGVEWHLSPVHVNYAGNLNVLMKYVNRFLGDLLPRR